MFAVKFKAITSILSNLAGIVSIFIDYHHEYSGEL
jgi:hypothetical protein